MLTGQRPTTNDWQPGDPVDFVTQYKVRAYNLSDPSCTIPTLELLNITAYYAASRAGNGMTFARDFICRTDPEGYFLAAKEAIADFMTQINNEVTDTRRQIAKLNADVDRLANMRAALKEKMDKEEKSLTPA